MKKTKEYKKGFLDGYNQAIKDCKKIRKESERHMKPIRDVMERLRNR